MKVASIETVKEYLNSVGIHVNGTTKDFFGNDDYDEEGLWCSGEKSNLTDYYNQGSNYIFGIHKKVFNKLDKMGWYLQWYDPGTLMCYRFF